MRDCDAEVTTILGLEFLLQWLKVQELLEMEARLIYVVEDDNRTTCYQYNILGLMFTFSRRSH